MLLTDGTNPDTRAAGLERVKELGLQERTIFNAISPQISQREIEAIGDSGVTAAILLAYNEIDFSPEGRTAILKGFDRNVGLLKIAEKARIKKILVDTIVFDMPSIAYATEAIKLVKSELGIPQAAPPPTPPMTGKGRRMKSLRGALRPTTPPRMPLPNSAEQIFLSMDP